MKKTCEYCSRNVNGSCEVYEEVFSPPIDCEFFELLRDDLTVVERIGFDMREVKYQESKTE